MKKFVASLIVGAFLLCPVGGVPTQSDDSASLSFITAAEAKRPPYKNEFHKPRVKKGSHKPSFSKPYHKPKYKKVKVKGYRKKNGQYVKPHVRHMKRR